jgi:hypothetical protein
VHVLSAVAVILSGLAAGVAFNNVVAMIPTLRRLDPLAALEVRRSASPLPGRCLVALAVGAALAGAALLVFYRDQSSNAQALLAVGAGLSCLLLAGSRLAMNVERSLREWRDDGPRDRYLGLCRRWEASQLVMAVLSVGVVVCYATASGRVA